MGLGCRCGYRTSRLLRQDADLQRLPRPDELLGDTSPRPEPKPPTRSIAGANQHHRGQSLRGMLAQGPRDALAAQLDHFTAEPLGKLLCGLEKAQLHLATTGAVADVDH